MFFVDGMLKSGAGCPTFAIVVVVSVAVPVAVAMFVFVLLVLLNFATEHTEKKSFLLGALGG